MTDQPESGPREFPIQRERGVKPHPTTVPWAIADLAYSVYAANHSGQSLQRIAERGGFYPSEMDLFLPDWREQASALVAAEARIAEVIKARDENYAEYGRRIAELDGRIARLIKENIAAEARVKELERDAGEFYHKGLNDCQDEIVAATKRAEIAERERDENERLLVLALKCDRSTIALLEDANAENARLRPVVEKLAGEDGFPFGYLELLAREALK